MTTTNSLQVLTKQGEALLARLAAEEKELVIDKFIFADVPDRGEFPSRDETIPSAHVMHEEAIGEKGRLTENSVIYTATLASNVGPFYFNWSGLYCSEHDVLVTVHYPRRTPKTADQPGIAGNTLVRSQVLQYTGVADITNITVDASTWQYNANDRMKKMDSDLAQANIDQNGKDWFIEDGFQVLPKTNNSVEITPGAGYVSGNRISLGFERIVSVPIKPAFIYVDAKREGTPTGEQITTFSFVVSAEEKDDYTDSKGVMHFVCKIAQVLADGSVSDLRPEGESASRDFVSKQIPVEKYLALGNAKRSSVDRFSDWVNPKDFGAVGDGRLPDGSVNPNYTDDTAAFLAAIATGKTLKIPPGSYAVSGKVAGSTGAWLGQDSRTVEFMAKGDNGGEWFFDPPAVMSGIAFKGDNLKGKGLRQGKDGAFTGHNQWHDIKVTGFELGVDVFNLYITNWDKVFVGYNKYGVNITPTHTPGVDAGYFTTFCWTNVLIGYNQGWGLNAHTPLGNRNWIWINVVIEANGKTLPVDGQAILKNSKVIGFGCYFEGNDQIPAFKLNFSNNLRFFDAYFNGTGGINIGSDAVSLSIEDSSFVSATDKNINYEGNANQKVFFARCGLPSSVMKASQSGVVIQDMGYDFRSRAGKVGIGSHQSMLGKTSFFKKVIDGVTIQSGESANLIHDHYFPSIMSGNAIGSASFTNQFLPDVKLHVTTASTGSGQYFCVYAKNEGAEPVTITNASLNVFVTSGFAEEIIV